MVWICRRVQSWTWRALLLASNQYRHKNIARLAATSCGDINNELTVIANALSTVRRDPGISSLSKECLYHGGESLSKIARTIQALSEVAAMDKER